MTRHVTRCVAVVRPLLGFEFRNLSNFVRCSAFHCRWQDRSCLRFCEYTIAYKNQREVFMYNIRMSKSFQEKQEALVWQLFIDSDTKNYCNECIKKEYTATKIFKRYFVNHISQHTIFPTFQKWFFLGNEITFVCDVNSKCMWILAMCSSLYDRFSTSLLPMWAIKGDGAAGTIFISILNVQFHSSKFGLDKD